MTDFTYVRFGLYYGSWHVVRTPSRVPGRYVTLCGRSASGPTADVLPLDEKSCESCARLALRKADNLATTDPEVYADGPREDDPEAEFAATVTGV